MKLTDETDCKAVLTILKKQLSFMSGWSMIRKKSPGDDGMICSVHTIGINGISGSHVTVECYISNGLPAFDIVGLPDAAVKEARERVRAAKKTSGMQFPTSRITVNLEP